MKPGSQHAKFLPIIRETIAKAKAAKIFEKYKQCTEGLKVPTLNDIRGSYQCTLAEAEGSGLIDKETMNAIQRVFAEDFSDVFNTEGTDGFKYQVDNNGKQPKVYALCIEGAKITDELFRGIKIASDTDVFPAAEKLVKQVMSEETPTFELSHGTSLSEYAILFGNLAALLPKDRQEIWAEIEREMKHVLSERGYHGSANISTWQEHKLGGSTTGWIGYSKQPYKPLGIVDLEIGGGENGPLGLEETILARELQVFTAANHRYYGLPKSDGQLPIFFEPLDSCGNTIRDPRAIDAAKLGEFLKLYPLEDAIEKCLIPGVVKSADFHNRRG